MNEKKSIIISFPKLYCLTAFFSVAAVLRGDEKMVSTSDDKYVIILHHLDTIRCDGRFSLIGKYKIVDDRFILIFAEQFSSTENIISATLSLIRLNSASEVVRDFFKIFQFLCKMAPPLRGLPQLLHRKLDDNTTQQLRTGI